MGDFLMAQLIFVYQNRMLTGWAWRINILSRKNKTMVGSNGIICEIFLPTNHYQWPLYWTITLSRVFSQAFTDSLSTPCWSSQFPKIIPFPWKVQIKCLRQMDEMVSIHTKWLGHLPPRRQTREKLREQGLEILVRRLSSSWKVWRSTPLKTNIAPENGGFQ